MTTDETPPITATYKDDDLVYVDPDTKTVIGLVEWTKAGNPKSKQASEDVLEKMETTAEPKPPVKPGAPVATGKERPKKRSFGRKIYPWGTYRSMKKVYQLEGKVRKTESNRTLDEILPKALETAFWE